MEEEESIQNKEGNVGKKLSTYYYSQFSNPEKDDDNLGKFVELWRRFR